MSQIHNSAGTFKFEDWFTIAIKGSPSFCSSIFLLSLRLPKKSFKFALMTHLTFLGLPLAIAVCSSTASKSVSTKFDVNTLETLPCLYTDSSQFLIDDLSELVAHTYSKVLNESETIKTTDSLSTYIEETSEVATKNFFSRNCFIGFSKASIITFYPKHICRANKLSCRWSQNATLIPLTSSSISYF